MLFVPFVVQAARKLASSVAHEVRNPLQAIRLTVQMLRDKCPPETRQGCDLIVNEIDRLNLLTDELLILAGKDNLRIEPVDLARELHDTLRLMQFQLRQRDIRAEVSLPALPAVPIDRNRCRQLLLNLLLNSAEASPRGGIVRIEGAVVNSGDIQSGGLPKPPRPDAAGAEPAPDEPFVVIRIADNGPGFPPQVLGGQGDEFFSTKTAGAGLGLSICRRIVEQAGGRLNLYNADRGAVAEVVLPTR